MPAELGLQIVMRLNELTRSITVRRRPARIISTISKLKVPDLLRYADDRFSLREISEYEYGHVTLWRCILTRHTRHEDVTDTLFIVELEQDGVQVWFYAGLSNFFFRAIVPLVKALYPAALRVFVRSRELLRLLEQAQRGFDGELLVSRAVFKRKYGEQRKTDVKFYHDPIPVREVFASASDEKAWVDTVQVTAAGTFLSFSISRSGIIRIYQGPFDSIFHHVIVPAANIGLNRVKLFENRARREKTEPRPLLVTFLDDLFSDKDSRARFVDTVAAYPNAIYSVGYQGNPHIYLSILDSQERSSFTLRSISDKQLLLTPQIRCTAAALMRFASYLVDNFDGEFKEYTPPSG